MKMYFTHGRLNVNIFYSRFPTSARVHSAVAYYFARDIFNETGIPIGLIAADDRTFHPANVRVSGNSVIISAPAVGNPVAIRYNWDNNPQAHLYNSAGLPASPFRSDDWPAD